MQPAYTPAWPDANGLRGLGEKFADGVAKALQADGFVHESTRIYTNKETAA